MAYMCKELQTTAGLIYQSTSAGHVNPFCGRAPRLIVAGVLHSQLQKAGFQVRSGCVAGPEQSRELSPVTRGGERKEARKRLIVAGMLHSQ